MFKMRTLIIVLLWPFGLWAQMINIDATNPFQPVVHVENTSGIEIDSDSSLNVVKKQLTMTQIIHGKPAPVTVSGRYAVVNGDLTFNPLTALGEGLEFEIKFRSEIQKYQTPIPIDSKAPPAYVEAVFPTSQNVPRNILFFHVKFSESMMHDIHGYENVRIIDNSGKELPLVWRQRSYWLEDQKVLVLMIHPGKVKRGIDMEIPFQIGETYTLEVLPDMRDVYGRLLTKPYHHQFTMTDEDYESPKVLFDLFKLPKVNSRKPLIMPFSEGMDHSSIVNGVKVYDTNGKLVAGIITWNENDQTFGFVPKGKWQSGQYQVIFEKKVCDFANNRLNRPFEMTEMEEVKKDEIKVTYNFEL
jgi:hypothetical protein